MDNQRKGFSYFVERDQIERYRKWHLEKRFKWLLLGNKLRKNLPEKTIAIQNAFRQGKM